MTDLISLDQNFVLNTYSRFPISVAYGKGCEVYDEKGKRYIDLGTGIGVNAFGLCDDEWVQAVNAQLNKVQHMSNLYYTAPCAELAALLCKRTGLKKVFFSNSGAEANECVIKAARKYGAESKGPEFTTIVTLLNSFHGRTITTLAATGQEHFHQNFYPLTPGFVHAPADDIELLKKIALDNKACAVMIECVQGEGGVIALEKEFVRELSDFCKQKDILLIVDEVQTGNGRCGTLYAFQKYGILPDLFSTAKGLGGGLPIGAAVFGEKVQNIMSFGDHGSTFGGNPIACAGALSIINRLSDSFLKSVQEKSDFIFSKLQSAAGVKSVSGMGLMIGIETVGDAKEIVKECMNRGVLCLTAKNKIRLLPSLNIPMNHLNEAINILMQVIADKENSYES